MRPGQQVHQQPLAGLLRRAGQQVLEHRHLGEWPRDLEGAAEAAARAARPAGRTRWPAPSQSYPRSGDAPGHQIEQRGFAGAVRADQPGDLAAAERDGHVVHGATSPPKTLTKAPVPPTGRRPWVWWEEAPPPHPCSTERFQIADAGPDLLHYVTRQGRTGMRPRTTLSSFTTCASRWSRPTAPDLLRRQGRRLFRAAGRDADLPPGQGFSIYSLSAVLPLLAAKQRPTDANDWMTTDAEIACPDPNCPTRLRITTHRQAPLQPCRTTAVPLPKA